MKVSITDFKKNFDKYLDNINTEAIYITKHGKIIAKLSKYGASAVDQIEGVLADRVDINLDKKRHKRYEIIFIIVWS